MKIMLLFLLLGTITALSTIGPAAKPDHPK